MIIEKKFNFYLLLFVFELSLWKFDLNTFQYNYTND